nr:hypothetical protein [Tanacetum cinerariifolium]
MANLSEDIQCVGSDTRPPMLDRTDFTSWQQCIRLYCRGKDNRVNILKSIDEGPFQIGTFRETLAEGDEGALHLGPERPRVYSDLSSEEKERGKGNNARGTCTTGYGGAQNRVRNTTSGQARQIKCYNCNGIGHITRNCTQPQRPLNSKYFKDKMLLMQTQENGVASDEEQLFFIIGRQDNADECDAFDFDVDAAPTAQTMFMVNLSFADPVYDEAGPSYDSDILFEVHDHDTYQDAVCELNEVHEMHDHVQPNCIIDSNVEYTSDSNMIPYNQYVKDNAESVVQNIASSVPHDAPLMIINEMHEQTTQCVFVNAHTKVVDASLTAELAIYREQVELYVRRAKFELTEREQKIKEQLRIVITDHNIKEENLKKELHSVKMQLNSTINHNKSMVEEVTSLKKDFKQKENKYLEEFLDMKALKEKVKDRLFKQDQSLHTVYMLCKPKPHYDEQRKIAIGYKNPLYLSKAKQVQPALYSGQKIVKSNHARVLAHDSEDTLEIAETTRKQMNEKMKDPECVKKKDLIKIKSKALKEQTSALRPIKALTVFTEMHDAHTVVQARCLELEAELFKLNCKIQKDDHNELVKRFSNLEAQINEKLKCVTKDSIISKVLAPSMYVIDVAPLPPHYRNNREVHLDYLIHLKEGVATLREIVKEARANGVVERRNCTLVEVSRTMLIFSKALIFLWEEALILEYSLVMHQAGRVIESITKKRRIMETIHVQFDELTKPMAPVSVSPPTAVPVPIISAGTPSSTTIDQDAPSPNHSPSSLTLQSPCFHHGVAAGSTSIEDNPLALVDNDPFVNDHPLDNIIGNPSRLVSTRKQLVTDALWCFYNSVLLKVEPKNFKSAINEDCWFQAKQDEIHEFDRLQVGGQGMSTMESFAPIPCIEAIRIFIANAVSKNMTIYHMDVKTAFLNSKFKEKVYVSQPEGFVDPDHPMHVYRLKKALYGLKQAPWELYDTLSWFLLNNNFSKGQWIRPYSLKKPTNIFFLFKYMSIISSLPRPTLKHVEKGMVELYFVTTDYQLANMFTKALPRERFKFLLSCLGIKSMTPETFKCLRAREEE